MRNQKVSLTPDEVKNYVRKLNDLTMLLAEVRKEIGKKTADAEEGWNDENYQLLADEIEHNSKVLDKIHYLIIEFCKDTNCYAEIIAEGESEFKRKIKGRS